MADAKKPIWGTGRRKTAVARVRLFDGTGLVTINDKPADEYFVTPDQRLTAKSPLVACELATKSPTNRFSSGVGIREARRSASSIERSRSFETLRPESAEQATTGGRWRRRFRSLAVASSRSVALMSHLLRATSVAHPARIASSATRRSSDVIPSEASQTTSATSARSAARSDRSWA